MTAAFVPEEPKVGKFTIAFTLVMMLLIGLGLSGVSELAGMAGVMMGVFLFFTFALRGVTSMGRYHA